MRLNELPKMQSSINITPLVDVVLVLLIIFMVVAPMMRQGPGPKIDLPETSKPLDQADERVRITVTIDDHGKLWIEDQPVAPEDFGESLVAAANANMDTKIVIQGDARLRFGEVRATMLAVEQAGFQGVGLIAERAKPASQGD
jgi:biopolymer transport protein ExbD